MGKTQDGDLVQCEGNMTVNSLTDDSRQNQDWMTAKVRVTKAIKFTLRWVNQWYKKQKMRSRRAGDVVNAVTHVDCFTLVAVLTL